MTEKEKKDLFDGVKFFRSMDDCLSRIEELRSSNEYIKHTIRKYHTSEDKLIYEQLREVFDDYQNFEQFRYKSISKNNGQLWVLKWFLGVMKCDDIYQIINLYNEILSKMLEFKVIAINKDYSGVIEKAESLLGPLSYEFLEGIKMADSKLLIPDFITNEIRDYGNFFNGVVQALLWIIRLATSNDCRFLD